MKITIVRACLVDVWMNKCAMKHLVVIGMIFYVIKVNLKVKSLMKGHFHIYQEPKHVEGLLCLSKTWTHRVFFAFLSRTWGRRDIPSLRYFSKWSLYILKWYCKIIYMMVFDETRLVCTKLMGVNLMNFFQTKFFEVNDLNPWFFHMTRWELKKLTKTSGFFHGKKLPKTN